MASGMLTTGTKPFNVFARRLRGDGAARVAAANALLDAPAAERFLLACNRKENDEHWHSSAPEWLGKAAMSHATASSSATSTGRGSTRSCSACATARSSPRWRRSRRCARRRSATRADAAGRRRSASTSTATRSTRCRRSTSHRRPRRRRPQLQAPLPQEPITGRRPHRPARELDLARSPASVWEEPLLLGCAARSFDVVSACAQVVAGLVATGRRAGREGGPLLEPPAARLRSVLRAVWRFLAAADGRTQHSAAALWLRLQELAPAPAAQVLSYALRAAERARRPSGRPTGRRAPMTARRWPRSSHGSRCCGAPLSSPTRRRPPPPPPRRRTYTMQPTARRRRRRRRRRPRLRARQRDPMVPGRSDSPDTADAARAPTAAAAAAAAAAAVRWRARARSRACYATRPRRFQHLRHVRARRSGGCATPPPSLRRC